MVRYSILPHNTVVARNEDPTPGAQLLNAGVSANLRIGGIWAEVTLSARIYPVPNTLIILVFTGK